MCRQSSACPFGTPGTENSLGVHLPIGHERFDRDVGDDLQVFVEELVEPTVSAVGTKESESAGFAASFKVWALIVANA
jgi:hypothetical protein